MYMMVKNHYVKYLYAVHIYEFSVLMNYACAKWIINNSNCMTKGENHRKVF